MMDKEINYSTYQYPLTLEELIDDMEKHSDRYKHLQFILNRKKHYNLGLGQKYLVVNSIGFGLYELNSVDYSNGIIKLILIPTLTQETLPKSICTTIMSILIYT